ncbi:hypothetical protein [Streptomyces sp. NPDC055060]
MNAYFEQEFATSAQRRRAWGGAVLYTSGSTSLRMREYMAEHRIAAQDAARES